MFVVVGLGLLAALVLVFSRSFTLAPTYGIRLRTSNVGFLSRNASVLMAGVKVGWVQQVQLHPSGRAVDVHLKILQRYGIHGDARFSIDQVGFLGDQIVAIEPRDNAKPLLQDGDVVDGDEPFNLQEVARSASSLISRVDETAARLRSMLERIEDGLLGSTNLDNVAVTLGNFREVSDRALLAVGGMQQLVHSNSQPLEVAVSNLSIFATNLRAASHDARGLMATNRARVDATLANLEESTAAVRDLFVDARAGRGVAGYVLRDEQSRADAALILSNLTVLSSNLNRFGLLHKPKPARTASAPANRRTP